jgi:hypothetical protein
MLCKYCHLKTHLIDKCPTIICKICRDIGHPQWLCTKKKENKKNDSKNYKLEKKYSFNDGIIRSFISSDSSVSSELKKKELPTPSIKVIEKNIEYYKNLKDELWSNLA